MSTIGLFLSPLLSISDREVDCERRGFAVPSNARRARLEEVGRSFLRGYHNALSAKTAQALIKMNDTLDPLFRGFAHEGSAMALTLLDVLSIGGHRCEAQINTNPQYRHLMYVGVGWAWARLKKRPAAPAKWADPLLGWLSYDGFGFHEGYFHPQNAFEKQQRVTFVSPQATRAFDQGLGRSLWFVKGMDPQLIRDAIARMHVSRHGDLWSGVALAAAYAGSVEKTELEALRNHASAFRREVAQGAAFAAKARVSGNCVPEHTELACQVLCGVGAQEAAEVTDLAQQELNFGVAATPYLDWEKRIGEYLVKSAS
jgi:hypothetical protein